MLHCYMREMHVLYALVRKYVLFRSTGRYTLTNTIILGTDNLEFALRTVQSALADDGSLRLSGLLMVL
jgi:hypothetical protein